MSEHEDPSASPEVRVVDKRWWAQQEDTPREGDTHSDKPSYVEALEKQLAEKDDQLRDYAAKYKEASKEFEATRVRVRREVVKDVEREKRKVLAAFLDIVDNLDRALEVGRPNAADSSLLTGVEMVRQQFLATLGRYGVSPIEPGGESFDPTLHDAVSVVPVDDPAQHDIVVEVVKLGYRVDDDVLRPASVAVGRHEASANSPGRSAG